MISRALMKSTDVLPTARRTSAVLPRIAAFDTVFVATPATSQQIASREICVASVFIVTGRMGIGAIQPPFAKKTPLYDSLKKSKTTLVGPSPAPGSWMHAPVEEEHALVVEESQFNLTRGRVGWGFARLLVLLPVSCLVKP